MITDTNSGNLLSIFNYLIAKHGGTVVLAEKIEKEWMEYEEKSFKRNIMPLQRHYTPNEIMFIKNSWQHLSCREIALHLKRSEFSVNQRIKHLQKKGEIQFKREQNPLPLSLTYQTNSS